MKNKLLIKEIFDMVVAFIALIILSPRFLLRLIQRGLYSLCRKERGRMGRFLKHSNSGR